MLGKPRAQSPKSPPFPPPLVLLLNLPSPAFAEEPPRLWTSGDTALTATLLVATAGGALVDEDNLVENLHRSFASVSIVPALRCLLLLGLEVNHFFRHELLLLRLRNNLARPVPRMIKRAFDVFGSGLGMAVLSPFFAFLVLSIWRDGGRAFFGHDRIGQDGKVFKCYKFRSMVPNAQEVLQELLASDPKAREEWDRNFKLKNDPRITPIGVFLRKTSLDELPQLWNVFKGEMSLVGPRPVIEEELKRYEADVNYYLEVKRDDRTLADQRPQRYRLR